MPIPRGKTWTVKPPPGARINRGAGISQGLVGVFVFHEPGDIGRNLVSNHVYAPANGGALISTSSGYMLDCNGAKGISGAVEDALKIVQPLTIFWAGIHLANPASNANFCGVTYTNSNTSPYWAYGLATDGSPNIVAQVNNPAYNSISSTLTPSGLGLNTYNAVAFTAKFATGGVAIYTNASVHSNTITDNSTTYGASPQFAVGYDPTGTSRDAKCYTDVVYIWRRVLTQEEIIRLWASPYAIFAPPGVMVRGFGFASTTQTIAGSAGIASEEAFGSGGEVDLWIAGGSGIASAEAFGSGAVVGSDQTVSGSAGIASAETFGAGDGQIIQDTIVGSAGIASGEAFGSGGEVDLYITGGSGVASGEAFGADGEVGRQYIIGSAGIPSLEAFGSGIVAGVLLGVQGYFGIPTAETFGAGFVLNGPDESTYTLFIRGRDRTRYYLSGTLTIDYDYGGRGQAQFQLMCDPSTGLFYRPGPFDEVVFLRGTVVVFGGYVSTFTETSYASTNKYQLQVSCVDYRDIAARRTYSNKFSGPTLDLRTVVRTIVDATIGQDGVTYAVDAETSTITAKSLEFNGEPLDQCFARIGSYWGYDWRIDEYKVLHFERFRFLAAPTTIRDDDGHWRTLKITNTADGYRNTQGARTSTPVSGQRAKTFTGNGTWSYFLDYPMSGAPTVKVGSTYKTVVAFADRGLAPYDFTWESGSYELKQNPTQAAYTGSDTLVVTQPSPTLDVYWTANAAEVARMATRTGTSGIIESVAPAKNIRDLASAERFNIRMLEKLGAMRTEAEIETDYFGWRIGQMVSIYTSNPLCGGAFLVQSVHIQDVESTFLRYTIRCAGHAPPSIVSLDSVSDGSGGWILTVDTGFPHDLGPGDWVDLGGSGFPIDGSWPIDTTPTDTTFTIPFEGSTYPDNPWTPTDPTDPFAGGDPWVIDGGLPPSYDPGSVIPPLGERALVVLNVNTNTNEVTVDQAHGFTTSYPDGSVGTIATIIGVTGAQNGTSTINHPFTRITVTATDKFVAEDVGPLAGGDPFINDKRGRVLTSDQRVRTTPGNTLSTILEGFASASQDPTNTNSDRATFLLANSVPGFASRPLQLASAATNPWIAQADISVVESVTATIQQPPVGGPAIIDIKHNGTSIFASGAPLVVIPEGETSVEVTGGFASTPYTLAAGDQLVPAITSLPTGTGTFPGCNAVVNVNFKV